MRLRLLTGTILAGLLAGCAPPAPKNLVIISLDTVRADHLTPYGYERDTTPAIDRLARGGVVFDEAFAQDTRTVPSHASMFTGVYTHQHGCKANNRILPDGQVTLAQILEGAGFATAGFVSGMPMNRLLSGLDRGFGTYEDNFPNLRRDGALTTRLALDWLGEQPAEDPYFLFLHLFDAHGPYEPWGVYATMFESDEPGPILDSIPAYQLRMTEDGTEVRELNDYIDRYDGMLRYVDDLVSALLEAVNLDDTLVVVLSDHGETFDERFWQLDHGGTVFDEQTRIPLVLHGPGLDPQRVDDIVETVDLLPTLLDLLDVPLPAERPVQGRNLVPRLRGEPIREEAFTYATARAVDRRHADRGIVMDPDRQIRSIRSSHWKLIEYPGFSGNHVELYDLRTDPGEEVDAAEQYPRIRDEYLERLTHQGEGDVGDTDPSPHFDREMYEQLRSLGYLG